MRTLAFDAMTFAREVHKDQRRKYTGNPYTEHLAEVCAIALCARLAGGALHLAPDPSVIAAVSWLHDCVEDQNVAYGDLYTRFGFTVTEGVRYLSDVEAGNRAERKAAGRVRLAAAPGWVQTIKCADLISNTASVAQHDPKFSVTYLEEKRLLLDVMMDADPRLLDMARGTTGVRS